MLLPRGKGDQHNLPAFLPKELFQGKTVKVTRGTKQPSVAFLGEARSALELPVPFQWERKILGIIWRGGKRLGRNLLENGGFMAAS